MPIDAEGMVEFATNTEKFYQTQCNMATARAPVIQWEEFVTQQLLPRYRIEFHEPFCVISPADINQAANRLCDQFIRHTDELKKFNPS